MLDQAAGAGLVSASPQSGPQAWAVRPTGDPLRIERLDGDSLNPGAHFKDMTGWNRKALRVTLPPSPSPAQVEAAETLCALAALRFAKAAPAPG